jgi:hypothetical protein
VLGEWCVIVGGEMIVRRENKEGSGIEGEE